MLDKAAALGWDISVEYDVTGIITVTATRTRPGVRVPEVVSAQVSEIEMKDDGSKFHWEKMFLERLIARDNSIKSLHKLCILLGHEWSMDGYLKRCIVCGITRLAM